MVRFASMCNRRFIRNNTEAVKHYFQGIDEVLNEEAKCYTAACSEYKYSALQMPIEGVYGIYPAGNNYGSMGYYMDFGGANKADMTKKLDWLRKNHWIDGFTKAVAVKWTIHH